MQPQENPSESMAYRVKLGPPLAGEIQRIGIEQIEIARRCLKSGDDRESQVHQARKCLKRLRALFVLAEPVFGKTLAREEQRRYRDLGRKLSNWRDLDVMRRTAAKLAANASPATAAPVAALVATLDRRAPKNGTKEPGTALLAGLDAAERVLATLDTSRVRSTSPVAAAIATYGKCCKTLAAAERIPSEAALHDLRKCIQRHWRHMQLLRQVWQEELEVRVAAARQLSQVLGEHQDFATLAAFVKATPRSEIPKSDAMVMLSLIRKNQRELHRLVEPLGRRLLAETPDAFEARLTTYWRHARTIKRDNKTVAAKDTPNRPRMLKLAI